MHTPCIHHGVQVVVTDVSKLEDIRKREADITKERIDLTPTLPLALHLALTIPSPSQHPHPHPDPHPDPHPNPHPDPHPKQERIDLILGTGANVILTTKGIDDMALKYFVEAGAIAVRRCKKEDLRRIAKLTGGTLMITLADMEGNETYDASMLGQAEEVQPAPLTLHPPHPAHPLTLHPLTLPPSTLLPTNYQAT